MEFNQIFKRKSKIEVHDQNPKKSNTSLQTLTTKTNINLKNTDAEKMISAESTDFLKVQDFLDDNKYEEKPMPQIRTDDLKAVLECLHDYGELPGQSQENIDNITVFIRNILSSLPNENQKPNENKSYCKKCRFFKDKMILECGHNVCKQCVREKCCGYIENPTKETFRKFSCTKCKHSLIIKNINQLYYGFSDLLHTLENMEKIFQCSKCKEKFVLHKGFCSEMSCLHLCNNCYFDALMVNQIRCCVQNCEKLFKHFTITNQRVSVCGHCNNLGRTVADCYRSICQNHELCFSCLNIAGDTKKCPACNQKLSKMHQKILKMLINKDCVKCREIKTIDEIDLKKKCCPEIVCLSCHERVKTCMNCNQVLSYKLVF